MNKGYFLLTTLIVIIFSLGLSAQNGYPAPPENDSKEVMDRYQKAVDQWFKENPKEDQEVVIPEPEKVIEPKAPMGDELKSSDIPKDAIVWKLDKIEVIENGVIDEKLSNYQQVVADQASSSSRRLFVHNDKYLYLYKTQGVVMKFTLDLKDKTITLKEDNCPECPEHIIHVINYDSKSIITEKEYEDDKGATFTIRFSYSPV